MKTLGLLCFLVVIASLFMFAKPASKPVKHKEKAIVSTNKDGKETAAATEKPSVYAALNLKSLGLSEEAFDFAVKGYNELRSAGQLQNENILSIVDFSLHSSKKRLFIIDLKNEKLLFNTYVSHGRGSGKEMAKEFSNIAESNKSSLGFYVTGDTYMGKHGFSLRLLGQENGINDNANNRAIVMHSAAYVSEATVRMQGFVGRSLGCPAVPEALNKPIIETIKNGSCLFLYSPDKSYAAASPIIKKALKTS